MKINLNVDVHHLTRVEGHGNIIVKVEKGEIKQASWEVVETPRYFEAILRGQRYDAAGILTARICGICSIGHCLASIRATEHAFGIEIPEIAKKLRMLAKHGETLQSHFLHLFFLAAPDFINLKSVIPLLEKNPQVVAIAARLKGLANNLCDLVAGRTTHPVSLHVGGVSNFPDKRKLSLFKEQLKQSIPDLHATVDLFRTFEIPDFVRETEFVSLKGVDEYPFIGGNLISSDGIEMKEHEYRKMTNEFVVEHSTSKWCRLSRESFAVGALARLNNNYTLLHPEAKKVAETFGLKPVHHNPFMNNVAQLVEVVHCTYDSIRLINEILEYPENTPTMVKFEPKEGVGVGAVEVPRGILYHEYEYNQKGRIVKANCIIPTTQNNANIHYDIYDLVRKNVQKGMTDEKLELLCSMLVRAYDPCISCSVH
ncbi:MAG: Ni/Fe hydrogenase subunit alpha [bacterium]|nr:Ni/Fe hydrogenase subunit alpha [bacterium]